jgi:hydroxymethylpyrimidine/phosphomethylpyrimidine kinase
MRIMCYNGLLEKANLSTSNKKEVEKLEKKQKELKASLEAIKKEFDILEDRRLTILGYKHPLFKNY